MTQTFKSFSFQSGGIELGVMGNSFDKINKKTFAQMIIEQIKRRILAGELEPGEKLPSERILAEKFSVSRATVREALRALQYMDILEIRQNDGTYLVNDLNLLYDHFKTSYLMKQFTFLELLEARKYLEVVIAMLAAERASPEQLQNLREIHEREIRTQFSREDFLEADVSFHMALAEACENSFFVKMIEPVRQLLRESNLDQYRKPAQIQVTIEYHRQILEALENRNAEKASDAMRSHLDNIVKTTSEIYRKEHISNGKKGNSQV